MPDFSKFLASVQSKGWEGRSGALWESHPCLPQALKVIPASHSSPGQARSHNTALPLQK